MAAEDVARVYMALDQDDAVRLAIASGDYGLVDASGLNDYERKLLTDAATEEAPDVSGFALEPGQHLTYWAPYRYITINYATQGMTDLSMQAAFLNFQNSQGPSPDG